MNPVTNCQYVYYSRCPTMQIMIPIILSHKSIKYHPKTSMISPSFPSFELVINYQAHTSIIRITDPYNILSRVLVYKNTYIAMIQKKIEPRHMTTPSNRTCIHPQLHINHKVNRATDSFKHPPMIVIHYDVVTGLPQPLHHYRIKRRRHNNVSAYQDPAFRTYRAVSWILAWHYHTPIPDQHEGGNPFLWYGTTHSLVPKDRVGFQ